jgi:outer membrane receptor protein involved in Fe transport
VFAAYTTGERQYDYDVTFRGVSPYVEASATLFERLHLSGGLREDWIGYDYDNRLTELATGSHRRPASTSVAFDHLTPSAGATWEFDPATNAFVSWRHAFRVPSEDQLFVQGSATRSIGLEPVRANSYETGVRRSFGHRGRIEASVYRMDMKDDIVSFFNTTDFTSENSNAGRSRHWGVEAGFDLDLSPVRVEGSYSYNRHRYLEWLTSTGVDYGGNEMESGPRHLVNARVTGRLPRRSSLTAEWVSVGRYFTDPGNEHEYGGYDLINAFGHVGLTRELDLVARLNNAADVRYANTASFNPFVAPELRERFGPGLPRSLFVGVQYALGR